MGEVLLKLAERVEALTEPDREVDLEIARHFRVTVWKRNDEDTANYETTHWHYTDSIDDALTLVPDDPWVEIKGPRKYLNIPTHSPNYWSACVSCWNHEGEGVGWAATPALALCAAALRARSTLAPKGGA